MAKHTNFPLTNCLVARTDKIVRRRTDIAQGIDEDPVTGSAHCTLTPYWASRLGKSAMSAKQISARGGDLLVEQAGDRVKISGRCVLYLEGFATVAM